MQHDFSLFFDTDNEYWQKVLDIFAKNEKYDKKIVSNRNLHHKFPRSFSRKLGEPVDNDKDNLVSLSLGDHFLVHYYYYLLAKKGYRQAMATAFTFMGRKSLKYLTPETAEMVAKDYEEARLIADQYVHTEETKKKISESRKGIEPWNKGKELSEETKKKMSESIKASITPESRKFRSESKKGKPHPHRGGFQSEEKRRKISEYFKGKSRLKTEFGRKFKEHYNIMQMDDKALYAREYHYYRKHGVCSWERLNS